jgi:hypothetical protein
MRRIIGLACALLALLAARAEAQVKVRRMTAAGSLVTETDVSDAAPITVDISGWNAGEWVYIYHSGSPTSPSTVLPLITIDGDNSNVTDVVIAGPGLTTPPDGSTLLNPASYDLNGLIFVYSGQEQRTVLTSSVGHDVTGSIRVGRVGRLLVAHNLEGSLTATAPSGDAIVRLVVGNKIAAAVRATLAHIGKVVVSNEVNGGWPCSRGRR